MPVTALHHEVASIALAAARRHGFALAGGNALIEHGIIDRPTEDVDLFTDSERGVRAAAGAIEDALAAAGFTAEPVDKTGGLGDVFYGMGDGLAEWAITSPAGERMTLQLAYFTRERRPVVMEIGPVLDLDDVAAWKTVALASRAAPRDYVDVAALLDHYSPWELIASARRADPGLPLDEFTGAALRLDAMPDRRLGLTPGMTEWVREQFENWPR